MPLKSSSVMTPDPPKTTLKVGFVSLGCPKNLVDSEVMMGMLAQNGAELVPRAEDADVIVVNTCSFIESAQQESVNTILEMARHKSARAKKLVVAGCLVERFRDEIRKNIPEVDAVVGTGELENILQAAGVAPSQPADSPFRILRSRPEGDAAPLPAAFPVSPGTEPSPTFRITFTTKPRRAFLPPRAPRLTSRLPKAAITLAASASFRNCAVNSAHAILNQRLRKPSASRVPASAKSRS